MKGGEPAARARAGGRRAASRPLFDITHDSALRARDSQAGRAAMQGRIVSADEGRQRKTWAHEGGRGLIICALADRSSTKVDIEEASEWRESFITQRQGRRKTAENRKRPSWDSANRGLSRVASLFRPVVLVEPCAQSENVSR